ncbi:MAG: pyruvate synthase subunit beta [Firmicutes bacterium]|nr:pyruvate synthase subunit beta [Bacillota bacterium]
MKEINALAAEYLLPGHTACPGCGAAVAIRHVVKILGKNTVFVIAASCFSIIAGQLPTRAFALNVFHSPFASAAAVGSGLKRGLQALGQDDIQVVVLAGDGGTFDIGLQGLSAAAERNEDLIFICYDNEAYMNTGMQRSSATPLGAVSQTTPQGKKNAKKDIMQIMAAHKISYAATATAAFPHDLYAKIEKVKKIKGLRFLHLLCPCPAGWGIGSNETITISRLAVECGVFPLYEIVQGELFLNYKPEKLLPVKAYLQRQRRFASLPAEQINVMQADIQNYWRELLSKISTGNNPFS